MCEGVSYVLGGKFHSKTTQQPQGYGNNQHTKTYCLFLNGSPTNVNCLYNYVFPKNCSSMNKNVFIITIIMTIRIK